MIHDKIGKRIGVKTNALIPLIAELKKAKKANKIKDRAMKLILILFFDKRRARDIETTVPIVNIHVITVNLPIKEKVGMEKNDKPKRSIDASFKTAIKYEDESV